MRQYRFVRFLGGEVGAVGEEVAGLVERVSGGHGTAALPNGRGADVAPTRRIARELPRRLKRRLNGARKDGVEFAASVLSTSGESREAGVAGSGADLGVVLAVDLPAYALSTALLAQSRTPVSRANPEIYDTAGLAAAADRMLDRTPAAFVLALPVDGTVKAVPAEAVVALADAGGVPETFPAATYPRRVGRLFEAAAQGFVGDRRLVPWDDPPADREERAAALRRFQAEHGVRDLLYVEVSGTEAAARLTDFG